MATLWTTTGRSIRPAERPGWLLTIGDAAKYAAYSTSDSTPAGLTVGALVAFTYTVADGDNDANGISVLGPIDLNGGTIQRALRLRCHTG